MESTRPGSQSNQRPDARKDSCQLPGSFATHNDEVQMNHAANYSQLSYDLACEGATVQCDSRESSLAKDLVRFSPLVNALCDHQILFVGNGKLLERFGRKLSEDLKDRNARTRICRKLLLIKWNRAHRRHSPTSDTTEQICGDFRCVWCPASDRQAQLWTEFGFIEFIIIFEPTTISRWSFILFYPVESAVQTKNGRRFALPHSTEKKNQNHLLLLAFFASFCMKILDQKLSKIWNPNFRIALWWSHIGFFPLKITICKNSAWLKGQSGHIFVWISVQDFAILRSWANDARPLDMKSAGLFNVNAAQTEGRHAKIWSSSSKESRHTGSLGQWLL